MRRAGLLLFFASSVLWATCAPAQALPVFAHRYGLTCQACHTTVPHLNDFGKAFAANGFRLPSPPRGANPVAVKVNLAYSSDATPGLPKAIVDEVELLTGGALGQHFNYFFEQYVIDGGQIGLTRDAWLQYNSGRSHVRAGQFTLPLPVDPETDRPTLAHYLLFDQTVGANGFNFFTPRIGLEAYRTWDNGLDAHVAILQSYDRQSAQSISGSDLMGYVSKTLGEKLTLYTYRYQGQRHRSGASDVFYRQAFGAGREFGKLGLIAVLQHGNDTNAGAGLTASSSGGFLETIYAFSPELMAVARYDHTNDAISGAHCQRVIGVVMRPRRNMRFTIEDQITDHHTLNVGWLFAY